MPRTKNSNAQRGDFSRGKPRPDTKAAAGTGLTKLKRLEKLPPEQAAAIKSLELGRGNAGIEFKEHGSEPDRPIVDQPPAMPNKSARTD